jgi:hypothetical protein
MSVIGFATAQASAQQLAALRQNPELPADRSLPAGFLKNADDQTVLALTAVSRAMIDLREPAAAYQEWGLLAAPNLFGRWNIYQALLSYRKEGAWGVSPHCIPHHSLHAVSGTISQALQIHGPNLGISGGPQAVSEALLLAATMISDSLPGLWVVLSGHEPEFLPQQPAETPISCLAVALALKPLNAGTSGLCLLVSTGGPNVQSPPSLKQDRGTGVEFSLAEFRKNLQNPRPNGTWALPGNGWVQLGNDAMEEE